MVNGTYIYARKTREIWSSLNIYKCLKINLKLKNILCIRTVKQTNSTKNGTCSLPIYNTPVHTLKLWHNCSCMYKRGTKQCVLDGNHNVHLLIKHVTSGSKLFVTAEWCSALCISTVNLKQVNKEVTCDIRIRIACVFLCYYVIYFFNLANNVFQIIYYDKLPINCLKKYIYIYSWIA